MLKKDKEISEEFIDTLEKFLEVREDLEIERIGYWRFYWRMLRNYANWLFFQGNILCLV